MQVKYEGKIPKTLKAFADKRAHQIQEVTHDGGYCTDSGYAYDAFLRRGWRKGDDFVHTIITDTASQMIAELREIVACDCDYCKRGDHGR